MTRLDRKRVNCWIFESRTIRSRHKQNPTGVRHLSQLLIDFFTFFTPPCHGIDIERKVPLSTSKFCRKIDFIQVVKRQGRMNQLHLIKAIIGTFLLKGIADMLILTICRHVLSFLGIRAQSLDRPNGFLGFQLIAHQNSRQYHNHHHQHRYS